MLNAIPSQANLLIIIQAISCFIHSLIIHSFSKYPLEFLLGWRLQPFPAAGRCPRHSHSLNLLRLTGTGGLLGVEGVPQASALHPLPC